MKSITRGRPHRAVLLRGGVEVAASASVATDGAGAAALELVRGMLVPHRKVPGDREQCGIRRIDKASVGGPQGITLKGGTIRQSRSQQQNKHQIGSASRLLRGRRFRIGLRGQWAGDKVQAVLVFCGNLVGEMDAQVLAVRIADLQSGLGAGSALRGTGCGQHSSRGRRMQRAQGCLLLGFLCAAAEAHAWKSRSGKGGTGSNGNRRPTAVPVVLSVESPPVTYGLSAKKLVHPRPKM
ncbi:hypothetical protein B0H66DRAFT_535971 [Apodospora peruviana]|uniref:Uncharacterized protein n=1 Tax=Apodospora peruviana TaxID=516989 RepID=A0AAE0HYA3_9PEZI|nr:hypothetical protein B0H66DRAFT_535971 [Apodospora peruviana]